MLRGTDENARELKMLIIFFYNLFVCSAFVKMCSTVKEGFTMVTGRELFFIKKVCVSKRSVTDV